jgi:hypothetical protein
VLAGELLELLTVEERVTVSQLAVNDRRVALVVLPFMLVAHTRLKATMRLTPAPLPNMQLCVVEFEGGVVVDRARVGYVHSPVAEQCNEMLDTEAPSGTACTAKSSVRKVATLCKRSARTRRGPNSIESPVTSEVEHQRRH